MIVSAWGGEEQQKFYSRFNKSFLAGSFPEPEGNSNYAFILPYDILERGGYDGPDSLELSSWLNGRHYLATKI